MAHIYRHITQNNKIMKLKEYIEVKRRYVSPSIYVKVLQMEGLLAGTDVTSEDIKKDENDDDEGGNIRPSKRILFLEEDEI